MDNKKHIVNLESFRDMLHIFPRLPHQPFVEPPFEEEILTFLCFLGQNAVIRKVTDVKHKDSKKSNEMYYPRFTKVIIHHFMSKDPYIPRRNKVNWNYIRDDHMNSNAYKEYYAVATGAAPPKPKASVRKTRSSSDTTITPPTAAAGPRLTIFEKGKQAAKFLKPRAYLPSLRNWFYTKVLDIPTDESEEELSWNSTDEEGDDDEGKNGDGDEEDDGDDGEEGDGDDDEDDDGEEDKGTGSIPGFLDVPTDESEEELYWNSTNEEGDDDEGKDGDGDDDDDGDDGDEGDGDDDDEDDDGEEGNDDDDQEVERDDEKDEKEGNGEENLGLNVGREEGHDEEERKMNFTEMSILIKEGSSSVSSQFVTSMLNPTPDAGMESIFETTSQMDVHTPTSVAPLPMTAPTMTPSTIATITTTQQVPLPPTTAPSTLIQDLPNFVSMFGFDNRLKILEANFSEFMQTNQFARAVSAIPGIIQRYMDQRINKAVKVAVQIQSDRLRDEAQKENDEFLKTIDENMQKIIKEQVKEQVNVQVSKILPKIEQTVNEQLEAKVLTRSSHSSKTSYAVAADLSKMELKKILIEKIEGNKSIQRSDEQRNLYKTLVEAYESDKIILDTYGETVTLKRRHDDDADKDEEPSAGPDRGSKRRREGKEPESVSAPKEKATRSAGKSTQGTKSRQVSASESATAEEPMQTTFQMEEPSHLEFDTGAEDQPIVQSSQHPEWFSQQQKPPTLDRDWNKTLSASQGSIQPWINELTNLVELEYHLEEVYKATTDQLDWVNPEGASSRKYTNSVTKTKAADYGHIKWIENLVSRTMWIEEPIGYDKHALWGVSHWGVNVSSSIVLLLTESLLAMCILSKKSSLSLNSRL
nr:hypothetical protein [Tanacetum cinerariifolium]